MGAMSSQITCLTIVYSIVYSGVDRRKRQNCASLAFVRGIHRRIFTSEFPAQMASNAENVSIWWRSHVLSLEKSHDPPMQVKQLRAIWVHRPVPTTITTKRKLCAPSDVMKWTHFPRYSYKGPVTRSFDVYLMCTWTNRWANSPDAESRRHGDHCDVTVMQFRCDILHIQPSLSVSLYTTRTFYPITFNIYVTYECNVPFRISIRPAQITLVFVTIPCDVVTGDRRIPRTKGQ